jgi:UDP:flavonoid glycosyltransferase YjiC (YdhE family)
MRFLFSSRPAFGHVFAIAPLAKAAQDAGHEVVFASGKAFLDRLRGWGFQTAEVGEGIEWGFEQAAERFPDLLQPEQPEFGARMFVDVLGPRSLHDMNRVIAETQPDVVVYEVTDVGAGVAALASETTAVSHSLSRSARVFFDALRARMHVLWEELERDAVGDVLTGDVYLDIWPESMRAPEECGLARHQWSLRPITWADPSGMVPEWLAKIRGPLVFVSLGTVFYGRDVLPKVIAALEALDCDALVLAGVDLTPEDLAVSTDRIRVAGFVNQAEVLRHADVVVHHGGAGTLLGTLSRGLPALSIGAGADRPMTSESLVKRGAGLALDPWTATSEGIAQAISKLLAESIYRQQAEEVRREIERMPSPGEIVAQLEASSLAT